MIARRTTLQNTTTQRSSASIAVSTGSFSASSRVNISELQNHSTSTSHAKEKNNNLIQSTISDRIPLSSSSHGVTWSELHQSLKMKDQSIQQLNNPSMWESLIVSQDVKKKKEINE